MSEEQIPYQTEKYSSINLNLKFKFMQLKEDNISEFKEFFKKNLGCYNYICNYDKNNKSINIFQTNKIEMFETIQEIKINPDQVLKTHEFWEELIEDTICFSSLEYLPVEIIVSFGAGAGLYFFLGLYSIF